MLNPCILNPDQIVSTYRVSVYMLLEIVFLKSRSPIARERGGGVYTYLSLRQLLLVSTRSLIFDFACEV